MRSLGLGGVSHHTMRHTGVTLMLEAGVNPRVIQKLAGWTSLRMLERYGHARDAEARRGVTAMHTILEQALNLPDQQPEPRQESAETRAQPSVDGLSANRRISSSEKCRAIIKFLSARPHRPEA